MADLRDLGTRTDPEAGFSLPEVLVTVVIVSVAFAALLGGLMTSIVVSDLHRKESTADTIARSAAEAVKDVAVTYVSCAGVNAYDSALPARASVTNVEYWDGTSSDPLVFGSGCSTDTGLQRITVSASSLDGQVTETVQILKRRK